MKCLVQATYIVDDTQSEKQAATIYLTHGVLVALSVREKPPEPRGPGTELKKLLDQFGFKPRAGCKCAQHIREMDLKGPQWCQDNIDTIVGWLREEAQRAGYPFTAMGARILIKRAIRNARD